MTPAVNNIYCEFRHKRECKNEIQFFFYNFILPYSLIDLINESCPISLGIKMISLNLSQPSTRHFWLIVARQKEIILDGSDDSLTTGMTSR